MSGRQIGESITLHDSTVILLRLAKAWIQNERGEKIPGKKNKKTSFLRLECHKHGQSG